MNHETAPHGADHPVIPIFIDDVKYDAPALRMTGAELRALPNPDVGSDRDLWLETPGPADDMLIRPELTYDVKPGSKYYTAPSTINPGAPTHVHS